MQIIVKGKHLEMTDALRSYAEEKVGKVEKYFDRILKTEIEMSVERNPKISDNQVVEVTIFTSGPVIRAKESASDMYQAIDLVTSKLERQARKAKKKMIDRSHHAKNPFKEPSSLHLEEEEEEEEEALIVKTKSFPLKPMIPEEACLQMDLVGHDFFVFINADTEETNVVYRRKDGNYGLIEPGG
ncbi:MAG: ribosome-associated translation inhibitor RaiA [Actinomycetota bacterium]|nr:ribosome-associated translation inhibitor RaiA [Actinomycetota bacterium]